MRNFQVCALLAVTLAAPPFLFADFSYQQTTQITGGSLLAMLKMAGAFSSEARNAGAPITTTVYLKGNRMARVAPDSIEIIDLDNETMTHVDVLKKVYSVTTFAQMKEQIAQARQKMEEKQASQSPGTPASNPNADNVKMSFDVHVRKTGAQKDVSGLNASEAILTMTMNATDQQSKQTGSMAVTNDMWVVPEIPGYAEMRDFSTRLAEKMGDVFSGSGTQMSALLGQRPGANQALSSMATEMEKIHGVPVLQITRLGTTADGQPLPAASEAPLPPDNSPAMPSGKEIAKETAASALSGAFGGFGGFGRKKKPAADPTPASQNASAATPSSAVLMESQTQSSNFSSDPVDPSRLQVPAGYTQVQLGMESSSR